MDYLRDPGRWQRAGARGPRGVLMAGPPGTGKTLLARAVAGEARVPFFSVSGSGFVEVFAGLGAARVRDLFEQARDPRPGDHLHRRDRRPRRPPRPSGFGGNDEREQTLNQLLAEMDGFEDSAGVVVLAATNRPDALDPALRRPGRFDREVTVPLPGRAERAAILAAHARGKNLGPDADLDQVAAATPGFSGADLAGLLNEAAVTAVRDGRTTVTAADFAAARDRVLLGTRHAQPAGPRRARHRRRPRGRPRPGRHAVPARRPGQPGHRAGRRAGPRADRDAPRRRPPALRRTVPGRHPRRPPRRPGRRTPDPRRGLHRRRRRPGLRHRPGHPDGPRVRPQPGDRPGQLHQPARRLPRARPARLLRAHPVAARPGSRRPAGQRRNPRPRPAHQPPRRPGPAHRRPAGTGNRHRRPGPRHRPGGHPRRPAGPRPRRPAGQHPRVLAGRHPRVLPAGPPASGNRP